MNLRRPRRSALYKSRIHGKMSHERFEDFSYQRGLRNRSALQAQKLIYSYGTKLRPSEIKSILHRKNSYISGFAARDNRIVAEYQKMAKKTRHARTR
jgi:hypothetical protein